VYMASKNHTPASLRGVLVDLFTESNSLRNHGSLWIYIQNLRCTSVMIYVCVFKLQIFGRYCIHFVYINIWDLWKVIYFVIFIVTLWCCTLLVACCLSNAAAHSRTQMCSPIVLITDLRFCYMLGLRRSVVKNRD